jgi:hypothetical protein
MRIIHFWSISADGQRKRTRTERYFRVARLAATMTVKRRLLINHAGKCGALDPALGSRER